MFLFPSFPKGLCANGRTLETGIPRRQRQMLLEMHLLHLHSSSSPCKGRCRSELNMQRKMLLHSIRTSDFSNPKVFCFFIFPGLRSNFAARSIRQVCVACADLHVSINFETPL